MNKNKRKNRSPFGTIEGYEIFLKQINENGDQTVTISDQTVTNSDKTVTISDQTVTNSDKTVTISDQTVTKQLLNSDQTVTNSDKNNLKNNFFIDKFNPEDLYKLSNSMKQVFFHVFESCDKRKSLKSYPLQYQKLADLLGLSHSNIKQCFVRLRKKGFIKNQITKTGRGGHCIVEINESIKYHVSAFLLEQQKNGDQTVTKQLLNSDQTVTNNNVVSSSYINTTTNETGELDSIDFSCLSKYGFIQSHILQLQREYEKNPQLALPTKIIQESIDALAYDLKHNEAEKRFKNTPVAVLMSLLKQGKPYMSTTPEKFKTPEQEAIDVYLAAKERQEKLGLYAKEKLKTLEFEKWQNNLTENELLELCPESEIADGIPKKLQRTMRRRKALELSRDYFEAEVWPSRKEEMEQEIKNIMQEQKNLSKTS